MGFYGNKWLMKETTTLQFDSIMFSLESDLSVFDDLCINESFIIESVSFSSIIEKIKEYWIKLKNWFKEKIKFFTTKAKEYLKNNLNFGKNEKFDKSKNMKKDDEKSNDEEKKEEYSVEGMYYEDAKIGISFFDITITQIRAAYIEGYTNLPFNFENRSEIDDIYNDFKEKLNKTGNEKIFSSECKEYKYDITTPYKESYCIRIESELKHIISVSKNFTSLIKNVNEQYENCEKQINKFDKDIKDLIDKIKDYQGDSKKFGSLNYFKDQLNKNITDVANSDAKIKDLLEKYISNSLTRGESMELLRFKIDLEKGIGRKIETKEDIEDAMIYLKNNRSAYEKRMLKSTYEKEAIKRKNDDIYRLSVLLKMLKDSLQMTKDVGFKAVEYTQELFGYAQHNKAEYNKLLSIYNNLK